MKYDVYVAEQRLGTITVEASSKKEAKEKAIAKWDKYKGIPSDCYIDDAVVDVLDCVEIR